MKAADIRKTFLQFFEEREHAIIPSAPVVPQHDPTVLFTTAGMHPLVPYLLGEPHPGGKRLADTQKCIRTEDIDEVGDESHLTFFEMLGNWSLGDYFKEEAIAWSWELLTKELRLDPSRMVVSVFKGDGDAPKDKEAAQLWEAQGVPKERIFFYGKEDNWWGPAGETGPCGPDTEIFYWVGEGEPESEPAEDDRWLEVWNNVFMQYEKTADGAFEPLAQKNVDTGMGLERLAVVLQKKRNVYETDLFLPIVERIRKLSNVKEKHEENPDLVRAERIIADHLKAATFMIADGVRPSNTDRGYILRRLIRRAVRQARLLKIKYPFSESVAEVVVSEFKEAYPELDREAETTRDELLKEENKFQGSLSKGLRELQPLVPHFKNLNEFSVRLSKVSDKQIKELNKSLDLLSKNSLITNKELIRQIEKSTSTISARLSDVSERQVRWSNKALEPISIEIGNQLNSLIGNASFKLFETHGLPKELTVEELEKSGIELNHQEVDKVVQQEFSKHQSESRSGAKQKFAGGLADHSEKVIRQHTATHLLLAALRDVLGEQVKQRGSNITAERLRFDFSHPEKLAEEELNQVGALVNEWIREDLPVTRKEMSREEAERIGAQMEFGHKYPDVVSVYFVGDPESARSMEFCGGPHVERTGQIGTFTIKKQESVGAGVRRIKAIVE